MAGPGGGRVGWAGTAGAQPRGIASVKFVGSSLLGWFFFVLFCCCCSFFVVVVVFFCFLNKCTKAKRSLPASPSQQAWMGSRPRGDSGAPSRAAPVPRGGFGTACPWGAGSRRPCGQRQEPGSSLCPLAFRQQHSQRCGSASSSPRHPLALAAPAGGEPSPQRAPRWGQCQRGRGSIGAARAGEYF